MGIPSSRSAHCDQHVMAQHIVRASHQLIVTMRPISQLYKCGRVVLLKTNLDQHHYQVIQYPRETINTINNPVLPAL